MCLSDDVLLGVQARARNHYKRLQHASFLVVLAREITRHLTMKWPPLSWYWDGYFYQQVTNEGSIESP